MNSFLFLKGGPFRNNLDLLCARLDSLWTRARPVWTSGPLVPVLDPCLTAVGPWLIWGFSWTIGELLVGSLLGRIGFLGHFVIGFSVGTVRAVAASEGLEGVVSFISWKFGWLEIGKNGRFTRFKSP